MDAEEIVKALRCREVAGGAIGGFMLRREAADLIESLQAQLANERTKYDELQQYNVDCTKQCDALLVEKIDLKKQLAESQRGEQAAVEDLYEACKGSPCNNGICVKKDCTGNHIPCDFEWRGPQEATL